MGRQSQQSENIQVEPRSRSLGSSYPRQSVQVCTANSGVLEYLSSKTQTMFTIAQGVRSLKSENRMCHSIRMCFTDTDNE
jgi:hypothetical protein